MKTSWFICPGLARVAICWGLLGLGSQARALVITNAVTWSGTVQLTGDVSVAVGGKLTVAAGTLVQCQANQDATAGGIDISRIEIIVDGGELLVAGTAQNPATFTSAAAAPAPGNWYGIVVNNGNVTMTNFVVQYAVKGLHWKDLDIRFDADLLANGTLQRCSEQGFYLESNGNNQAAELVLDHFKILNNGQEGVKCSSNDKLKLILRDTEVSLNGMSSSQYNGIDSNSGLVELENCVVARNGGHGLNQYSYPLKVTSCTITNNGYWGINYTCYSSANATLRGNLIRGNGIADNYGGVYLNLVGSPIHLTLVGNTISDQANVGLELNNNGTALDLPEPMSGNVIQRNGIGFRSRLSGIASLTLSNNDFVGNSLVIDNQGTTALAANGNYWGEPTTTELAQGKSNLTRVYDIKDDRSKGQVLGVKWYAQSVAGGQGGALQTFPYGTGFDRLVSGEIATSQSWTGKVFVTGDVWISAGGVLTIAAGTTVLFDALRDDQASGRDTSRAELWVAGGELRVQGAVANPVLFTSSATGALRGTNDWGGLSSLDGDLNLNYFVVEYAVKGLRWLDPDIRFNTVILANGTLQRCSEQGFYLEPSGNNQVAELVLDHFKMLNNGQEGVKCSNNDKLKLILRDTEVSLNGVAASGSQYNGIDSNNGLVELENCVVARNGGHGLNQYSYPLKVASCTITNNGYWGINYTCYSSANATLRGNVIRGNGLADNYGGVYLNLVGSPIHLTLVGNTISDQANVGLELNNNGTALDLPEPMSGNVFQRNGIGIRSRLSGIASLTFSNNDFVGNNLVIDNQGTTALAANGNYWGEPTTTELAQGKSNQTRVYDIKDDRSKGQVLAVKWYAQSAAGGQGGALQNFPYGTSFDRLTSGEIATSQSWTGKVFVTGDVWISAGGVLTIAAGTTVWFDALRDDQASGRDTSRAELWVAGGELRVQGAAANPVLFTSSATGALRGTNDWGGLSSIDGDLNLNYFVVEYAVKGLRWLDPDIRFNTISLANGTLQRCSEQGFYLEPSGNNQVAELVLDHFKILSNGQEGVKCSNNDKLKLILRDTEVSLNGMSSSQYHGIESNNGLVELENCVVARNGGHGLNQYSYPLKVTSCTITNNGYWGINYTCYSSANATLRGNLIRGNGIVDNYGGVYLNLGGSPIHLTLVGNTISDQGNVGLEINNNGNALDLPEPMSGNVIQRNGIGFRSRLSGIASLTFSNNDFVGNNLVIDNQGSTDLLANRNYWGEPTTSELIQGKSNLSRIYDKQDNSTVGQVVITQYATNQVVVMVPIITQQPTSQTVNQGGTAAFNVSATSDSPMSYQWRYNSTNLINGGRFSGAASNLLTVVNVDASNAGNYTVVVSNGGGSVTSSVATLTITTGPPVYHVADFRDPRWAIDGTEANRVLTYWRAGAYHLEPAGLDGYAGGSGNTNGVKHSADYSASFWIMDGTEANRVLSYWRAGGYHADASGADGYAPGKAGGAMSMMVIHPAAATGLRVNQDAPATYQPGRTLTLQTRLAYGAPPLSLLWRPRLPLGWRLLTAAGEGNPEASSREILWTGTIPPQQIQMTYTVEVPAGDSGLKEIQGEVECHFAGQANPITLAASPGLVLGEAGSGFSQITAVECLPNGQVQLQFRAESGSRFEIQVSSDLARWETLTTVVGVDGTMPISDPVAMALEQRFYRARRLP